MKHSTSLSVLPPAPAALQHLYEYAGLTWIACVDPRQDMLNYLAARYRFHPLHLDDVRAHLQRPKIDDNDEQEYLFLVLHFPVFNEQTRLSTISEVELFVGRDYIVSIHDGRLKPIRRLVERAAEDVVQAQLMARGSGYLLYRIVQTMISYCVPMLNRIYEKLDQLEEHIFEEDLQKTVEELSFLRRDIISLRRIIRPNITVLRSLAARERSFLRLDEEAYFGDLTDDMSKVWDILEEQKEIIEGLDATLWSLTSHRSNQEMKTFTLISVIFLPMTLIASILGMNVIIPLSENPMALPLALLIMVAIAGGMVAYFRYRRWI
jgi:magnesium transporter